MLVHFSVSRVRNRLVVKTISPLTLWAAYFAHAHWTGHVKLLLSAELFISATASIRDTVNDRAVQRPF